MSISSHALYLTLTQDLQKHLPNVKEVWSPTNLSKISFDPLDSSTKSVAAAALLKSIFKKFEDDSTDIADQRALDLFISMNDKCRGYTYVDIWNFPEEIVHVFTWAKSFIDRWLCRGPDTILDPSNWVDDCAFGPGASVDATGTSFFHKIGCSPLTQTNDLLYSFYMEYMRSSPTWIKAEKLRRDLFGRPALVGGSKLCFVPKSSEISRTICVEPSLNMFVQKGIGKCLERCLSRSLGFDLSVQQFRNKRLARLGSKTGRYGTIDLSSASDTISQTIVEYLFPESTDPVFELCRSPETTLPNGERVELHMISSMGNAFTFPLQTMIFSAIALGVYKVCGVRFRRPDQRTDGNLGVFGDDIVIDARCFDLMCRSLEAAGFIVNKSKSFNTGLFRESCGGDYFDGHNVRGVYCKSLRTSHARYSLINRLNDWSATQKIPLPRTLTALVDSVRYVPVPPWESDIAGIKVPLEMAKVKRDSNGSYIYKRYMSRSMSFDLSNPECWDGKKAKKFRLKRNDEAIFIAATKGTLRNGSLNVRLDVVRPNFRFGVAPCWDYIDLGQSRLENADFDTWKQAVLTNVGSR
jgi:hypothetical protein